MKGILEEIWTLYACFLICSVSEPHTYAFITSMLSDMPVLRLFAFKMIVGR